MVPASGRADGEATPIFVTKIPPDTATGAGQEDIGDICTHEGQPLADGPLQACEITCPRHGARFDIRTGKPLCMPATEPVRTFEVQVRDGKVFARPPE